MGIAGTFLDTGAGHTVGIFEDPTAGFFSYSSFVRELATLSSARNADELASITMAKIKESIVRGGDTVTGSVFGKIASTSPMMAKIYISVGESSDAAAKAEELYLYQLEVTTLEVIGSAIKMENPLLPKLDAYMEAKALEESSKTETSTVDLPAESSGGGDIIKSTIEIREEKAAEMVLEIEDPGLSQIEINLAFTPVSPNTELTFEAPPEDYASIFGSSSANLFSNVDTSSAIPVSIPGTEKFIGLGIDADRPSIIAASNLSKAHIESDQSFKELLLARELKVKQIYDSLQGIESSKDFDALLELYEANLENATTVMSVMEDVKLAETAIRQTIAGDASTELFIFGYAQDQFSTQAFLQAIYDLGRFPFRGPITWNGKLADERDRRRERLAGTATGMKIESHDEKYFANQLSYFARYSEQFKHHIAGDIDYLKYATDRTINGKDFVGSADTTSGKSVGFYGVVEDTMLTMGDDLSGWTGEFIEAGAVVFNDFYTAGMGVDNNGGSLNTPIPHLAQMIYTELMLSKLVSEGDPAALAMQANAKEEVGSNLADYFLGGMNSTTNSDITTISSPQKLAGVAKYLKAGQTFYPFESNLNELSKKVSSGASISGKTFYDDILRVALGQIVEGSDYDLSAITDWADNTQTEINDFLKYVDLFCGSGGGLITLNEAILSLIKFHTESEVWLHHMDPDVNFNMMLLAGAFSRNVGGGSPRTDEEFESALVAIKSLFYVNILQRMDGDKTTGSMVFNTMGWNGAIADIMAAKINVDLLDSDFDESTGDFILAMRSAGKHYIADTTPKIMGFDDDGHTIYGIGGEAAEEDMAEIYKQESFYIVLCGVLGFLLHEMEKGLTNSISLLLSDKSFIEPSSDITYSKVLDGFFTVGDDGVERTAFSGISRFRMRRMMFKVLQETLQTDELQHFGVYSAIASGLNYQHSVTELLTKMALVSCSNINPDDGPVRWKITSGEAPGASKIFDQISTNPNVRLIPQEVRQQLVGGISDINEDGAIDAYDDLVTGAYDFLTLSESFCKLTYLITGEDDGPTASRTVYGNRGVLTGLVNDFILYRSPTVLYKAFINSVLQPYDDLQSILGALAENDSTAIINEVAQSPGVEGVDIITFNTGIQDFNRHVNIMENKGIASFRYLPSKFLQSTNDYLVANLYLDFGNIIASSYDYEVHHPTADEKAMTCVHTIGIPAGLSEALNDGNPYRPILLRQDATILPMQGAIKATPVDRLFLPNLYLSPGCFRNIPVGDAAISLDSFSQKTLYTLVKNDAAQLVTYDELTDYLITNEIVTDEKERSMLLHNLLLSYSIELVLEVLQGTRLNQDTFRYDPLFVNHLVEPDAQKLAPNVITGAPAALADYFSGPAVKNLQEILDMDKTISGAELSNVLGSLECRLLSGATIPASALGTRIFDRVYHVLSNPCRFELTPADGGSYSWIYEGGIATGMKVNGFGPEYLVAIETDPSFSGGGVAPTKMRLNISDEGGVNKLLNDHLASYYFTLIGEGGS